MPWPGSAGRYRNVRNGSKPDGRFGWKADIASSKLPPARQQDENKADEREEGTASDPWSLIDHEARCWPMNEPGALSDPKEADQQRKQTEDQ